jgi:hypothetical protein
MRDTGLNGPGLNGPGLHRRLTRLLVLYPRDWRIRYGAEVVRLTEELIAAGEITPAQGTLNLAANAVVERGRAVADSRRAAAAMALAALVAVAGSFYATGHPSPARPASAPPARASLTRVLCSFSKSASGKVEVVGAVYVVGLRQTGPAFTLNLPAGTDLPPPGQNGPAGFIDPENPGQGQSPLCAEMAVLCQTGTGRTATATSGLVVRVTVKPGNCVLASPDTKAVSGP